MAALPPFPLLGNVTFLISPQDKQIMNAKADPLRWRVFAMAVTTAITIANVYHCQPILSKISDTLGATDAQIGNLPVLTQVGVGMGLLFLAPLGDMLDRKSWSSALSFFSYAHCSACRSQTRC